MVALVVLVQVAHSRTSTATCKVGARLEPNRPAAERTIHMSDFLITFTVWAESVELTTISEHPWACRLSTKFSLSAKELSLRH